jgi:hypothetical protein
MIEVNAVDSFCDLKSISTTGNGEKKLYLSTIDSLDFMETYLGISIANGSNIYDYNDEFRVRTKGLQGFITKSNFQYFFNATINEYSNNSKYRTNLRALRQKNQTFLNMMSEREYFQIDCSISQNRIYIGSKDANWFYIPSFSIPNESKVRIVHLNNSRELRFELL